MIINHSPIFCLKKVLNRLKHWLGLGFSVNLDMFIIISDTTANTWPHIFIITGER